MAATRAGASEGDGRKGTRSALVTAATELLEREGIGAVTLRGVGERIGVSRTAPYRHFADKEELLSAVAASGFERLGAAIAAAVAPLGDPAERLEAMGVAYVRFALDNPAHYRLMFGAELRNREHPDVTAAGHATNGLLVAAVAAAQAEGRLPPGEPLAYAALLWSEVHGAVDLTLAGHVDPGKGLGDPAAQIRLLVRLLVRVAEVGGVVGPVKV